MIRQKKNKNGAAIIDITFYNDKKRAEFIGATVAKIAGFLNLINPNSLENAAEYLFVTAEGFAKKYPRQNKKPCQRANTDKAIACKRLPNI